MRRIVFAALFALAPSLALAQSAPPLLKTPTLPGHAANKGYVDGLVAPKADKTYVDTGLAARVPLAPASGSYIQRNGVWTAFSGPMTDVPNDGQIYGRSGTGWAVFTGSGGSSSVTSSSVISALGFTPLANTGSAITTALGYAPVSKAGDTMAGVLGLTGNTSGDLIDVRSQTVIEQSTVNGIYFAPGGPSIRFCEITGCTGNTRTKALFQMSTVGDSHTQENTIAINTYVGTGESLATSDVDNGKEGFVNNVVAGPGGGSVWGAAMNVITMLGYPGTNVNTVELDATNHTRAAAPDSNMNFFDLVLGGGISEFPITSYLAIGAGAENGNVFAAINGIMLLDTPNHKSFRDYALVMSVSPKIGIVNTGQFALSWLDDRGSMQHLITARGTYSGAIIDTSLSAATVAIETADNQLVCLKGVGSSVGSFNYVSTPNNCLRHSPSGYLEYTVNGGSVFAVSEGGNLTAAGTIAAVAGVTATGGTGNGAAFDALSSSAGVGVRLGEGKPVQWNQFQLFANGSDFYIRRVSDAKVLMHMNSNGDVNFAGVVNQSVAGVANP